MSQSYRHFTASDTKMATEGYSKLVKIIQVTDIRLEVVQNFSQLHPCFLAVDGLDRVGQLAQFAAAVEVHTRCISIDPVAHAAAFMLHTEVLNLMSVLL